MRILLVSGGSIGHIAPLIAIWRAIQKLHPDATARVICADRPEEISFLHAEQLEAIPIARLRWSLLLPWQCMQGYMRAGKVIRSFRPDVVVSKGSSVSIPVCLAAKHFGIPIVLHESDAVMGRANRFLSRWADVVCLGFSPTSYKLPVRSGHRPGGQANAIVTGNPVRPDITQGSRTDGLRITGFTGEKPILLVLGGSQGAQAINEIIATKLDALCELCDVIHLTGPGKSGGTARKGYYAVPFANRELPHFYAITNAAISRAGAGSISELHANGIPTMLVPLRGLAQDHQVQNAQAALQEGTIVLDQEELSDKLLSAVAELLKKPRVARPSDDPPSPACQIAKIVSDTVARRSENA